jgi:hypothetical protein
MEIVDIENRNSEISNYISAEDRKAYEQNPLLVSQKFTLNIFIDLYIQVHLVPV